MICKQGLVTEILAGKAVVQLFKKPSSCSACTAGRGCGAGLLTRLWRVPDSLIIPAENLSRGQLVRISVSRRALNLRALLIFGLPVVALLLGGALGFWGLNPLWSLPADAGISLGMLMGLLPVALVLRNLSAPTVQCELMGSTDS